MRATVLDYSQIALAAEALAPALRATGYDGLAAILRGGLHLAAHAAFATGLPLHFLSYSREKRQVTWHGPAPSGQRLLLCEDFAGRGHTLVDCEAFLVQSGFVVDALVVCADAVSRTQPRWSLFQTKVPGSRFLLPWERHCHNPEAPAASTLADHQLRRTAWDLDGVFVQDVESHHYRSDLDAALDQRDLLSLASFAPAPASGDLIITGRPEGDAERTRQWCRRVGLDLRIIFRDDGHAWPSPDQVALWKGRRALAEGCTDYVESDAAQATLLATGFPELRICWWNEGQPTLLQASRVTL